MRLPGRRALDPSGVRTDWTAFLAVTAPVVADPDAVRALDDDALLRAAVHVGLLRRAAASEAVARALPGVAFADFGTPWDAALLSSLPALAHAAALLAPEPPASLAALVAEPVALAALAGPPEPAAGLRALATATGTAHYVVLERALRQLGRRTRPGLGAVLGGPGSGAELGDTWAGRPADWADERWRWDRQRTVLSVDVLLGAPDYDDQLALLPPVLPLAEGAPPVSAEQWLIHVEEHLDVAIAELEESLVLQGGRREPWTAQPWREVEVALRVRTGSVRVTEQGERTVRVEVPLDPGDAGPADRVVAHLLATTCAGLLEAVPDVVPHARVLLEQGARPAQEV